MAELSKTPYSWETKMQVVARYMLLGNMRLISEQFDIPYETLIGWRKQEWWAEVASNLKKQRKQKQSDSLISIIENGMETVKDRLENGDYVMNNKTGAIVRKPVSLRDAATLTNQLLSRQLEIEKLMDKYEGQKDSVQDTLKMLAQEFAKWQRINNKNATPIAFEEK